MKFSTFMRALLPNVLIGVAFAAPQVASAQWNSYVGAESADQADQADALLPNELWIWAKDSVTWHWQPQNEVHTVTLVQQPPGTPPAGFRPPPGAPLFGCPVQSASPATYTGAECVSSGIQAGGAVFTVKFPSPGNFKFVCLIHTNMNGTVHVLQNADKAQPFFAASLPYTQADYNRQAVKEAMDIIEDAGRLADEVSNFPRSKHEVIMTGEVVGTGGGRQYLSIVRFFPAITYIHKGETVEFTNLDPTEPHTITSGVSDTNASDQALVGVSTTGDGSLASVVNSAGDFGDATPTSGVNSGFLQAAPEDAVGRAQSAPGTTRLRVTFNIPGVFNYHCALHDVDGMYGKVVVND
jgi:plastocyanin